MENVILVITLLFWRIGVRILRSTVPTEREHVYVKWARAAGALHVHIIFNHLLPNDFRVAFLWITMSVAFASLIEASLSFLGPGHPTVISWGQMLNTAFSSGNLRTAGWWAPPPAVASARARPCWKMPVVRCLHIGVRGAAWSLNAVIAGPSDNLSRRSVRSASGYD